jgi:hypothetical protein
MKNLIIGMSVLAFAMPAFATKARLVALGEEITGSLYISDSRNIFLNAAAINDYGNTVILEWGSDGAPFAPAATPPTSVKLDADNNNQGEGGVLYRHNSMVYGIYLGAESAQTHDARQYLSLNNRAVHQDNQLDFFVGGDAGVKWGANLTYSKNDSDSVDTTTDIDSQTVTARLGVMTGALEAFVNVALMNKWEGNLGGTGVEDEFEGKLGYELGGAFNTGKGKVFAFWRHAGWDQKSDQAIVATVQGPAYTGEAEGKTDRYIVGYGHENRINDKATLFYKLSYRANTRKFETKADGDAQLDDQAVPFVIGLEHDSASWLTLRGSITHNIWGQADNDYDATLIAAGLNALVTGQYADGKRTIANSTNVNAGATIKFGDFAVDGLLGTGTGSSATESGTFTTDNLMSRVAMTYKF